LAYEDFNRKRLYKAGVATTLAIYLQSAQLEVVLRITHINITIPPGGENAARQFYGELLGLPEIPKPQAIRARGGVWFDAGGLDIHLSVEQNRAGPDSYRHFGLESADVSGLRTRLESAGIKTDDGRPAPWKRFFVFDPFGNRIEIHEIGGLRG
jgi:catechol 2,3-dioxygenase-like lactoylglutathione lyase family enzyme